MLKILMTSAGSLETQNVLESLRNRRSSIRLIGASSNAEDPLLNEFDQVYITSKLSDKPFEDQLLKIVAQESPDLIIPGRDDDVVFLAGLAERKPELAPLCLSLGSEAADIIRDKWKSYQFCRDVGLPFLPCSVSSDPEELTRFAEQYSFPIFAKPRQGAGSRGIYMVQTVDQLLALASQNSYLFQQFWGNKTFFKEYQANIIKYGIPFIFSFEEIKFSMQTFVFRDGSMADMFCSWNHMKHGVSMRIETTENKEVEAIGRTCAEAFAKIGWRGPLNIQGQFNENNEYAIYEFNGRFTGATAARAHLGYDELKQAVDSLTSHSLPDFPEFGKAKAVEKRFHNSPIQKVISSSFIQMS
jgi:carbamoyl-phosphate synthase large subunit